MRAEILLTGAAGALLVAALLGSVPSGTRHEAGRVVFAGGDPDTLEDKFASGYTVGAGAACPTEIDPTLGISITGDGCGVNVAPWATQGQPMRVREGADDGGNYWGFSAPDSGFTAPGDVDCGPGIDGKILATCLPPSGIYPNNYCGAAIAARASPFLPLGGIAQLSGRRDLVESSGVSSSGIIAARNMTAGQAVEFWTSVCLGGTFPPDLIVDSTTSYFRVTRLDAAGSACWGRLTYTTVPSVTDELISLTATGCVGTALTVTSNQINIVATGTYAIDAVVGIAYDQTQP